jgi:hypothetical protein
VAWPDVVTAVATAVAAVAAVAGVLVAAVPYRRDVARRVRDHASHISVWYGPDRYEASVRNTSTEAAYDLSVAFYTTDGVRVTGGIDELPVLPPLDTVKVPADDTVAMSLATGAEESALLVEVRFTDRNGQRWARWSSGSLRTV